MDVSTIVKENTRLQQHYANNLFDTITLIQDHAERTWGYWNYQMSISNDAHAPIDRFWTFMKSERDDLKNFMNEYFDKIEVYFSGAGSPSDAYPNVDNT